MLRVDAPANLALGQAVMRKIATFELIDGEFFETYIWKYDFKEDVDYYMEAAGIESSLFMFTFGLPLYIFLLCIVLAVTIPLINYVKIKKFQQ